MLDDEDNIIGVFAFVIGIDPTYVVIKEGKWISNKTYGTIHRLASSFDAHGIFSFVQSTLKIIKIIIGIISISIISIFTKEFISQL